MVIFEQQGYISNDESAMDAETTWETDLDWDTFYDEYEALRRDNSIIDSLNMLAKRVG